MSTVGQVVGSMQSSTMTSKVNTLQKWVQFIWAARGLISIVLLIGTLFGYLASEMIEHRRSMLREFSVAQLQIATAESEFRSVGESAFSGPSRSGKLIGEDEADRLSGATESLRASLLASLVPNAEIRDAQAGYLAQLANLQGKLNLHSMDVESTEDILRSLISIQIPADRYHEAETKFRTSVWTSFLAAF